jgi:carboxymethylenebutenolidase
MKPICLLISLFFVAGILLGQEKGSGKMISFEISDDRKQGAYFLKTEKESDNYLFVFHDWRGLTDQTKEQAEKLFADMKNVNVLAIDMYGGKVVDKKEEAEALIEELEDEKIENIIEGAVEFASKNARIGTIGWDVGGSWALQAAIIAGSHSIGSVLYYCEPEDDVDKLKFLQAPVLGLFAEDDETISAAIIEDFEEEMDEAEEEVDIEMLDAAHGFSNPADPNFDKKAAEKAHEMALEFLKKEYEEAYE